MSKYLNKAEAGTLVMGEKESTVEGSLVAKVKVISSESLTAATKYLKSFIDYDRADGVDVVVAELQDALAERLQAVMNGPEEKYHFSKTGHLCVLFNHIQNQRKIPVHYTDIKKYPRILKEVKKEMESRSQSRLYQICTEANKEKIKEILEKEKFSLI